MKIKPTGFFMDMCKTRHLMDTYERPLCGTATPMWRYSFHDGYTTPEHATLIRLATTPTQSPYCAHCIDIYALDNTVCRMRNINTLTRAMALLE